MVWRLNWHVGFVLSFLIFNTPFGLNFSFAKDSAPEFQKSEIKFGHKKIKVEMATTQAQHAYGLMNRSSLPIDEGMLFVFNEELPLSFWMKNTIIDLAIAYIDKNRIIVDIQEMKATTPLALSEPPSYPSAKPARYALEMNKGWFKKNKIKVGDKFDFLREKTK